MTDRGAVCRESRLYGSERGWSATLVWMQYCGTAGKPGGKQRKQTSSYSQGSLQPTRTAPKLSPYRSCCTGVAERRPGPNGGKADVLWEGTGKRTTRAAGVGVQARRERFAEITSGRSYSQQGLTTTCKDPPTKAMTVGGGRV